MVLVIPFLFSCGAGERGKYHGSLYYGQGPYLMQFSLGDGSVTVVNNLGDRTIRDVSDLGGDKLLIAETAWIQSRSVPRISWFDLKTGQSAVLYSGVLARYVADAGIIVYDDGSKLYAVPQLGTGTDEILVSHGLNQLSTLTVVADHVLLFETVDAGRPIIHSWNAVTGERQRLDALTAACRLSGAVWIDSLQRLACKGRTSPHSDGDYALADLAGAVDGTLGLPADKRFLALAYIAGQDAVVLRESWQGILGGQDKSAVWVHDVRTGANHRLARNLNLGSSVVYADF
jgi:hypothetical protein